MSNDKTRVGLARKENRRENTFAALDLVRREVEPRLRVQVLLKPNFLSCINQLAATHADAIRGVIDFLLTTPQPPGEIIIAEGCGGKPKYSGEGFANFGYHALKDEYPVPIRLVDLNEEKEWEETTIFLADRREVPVAHA